MEAMGSSFSTVTMKVISRAEDGVLYGGAVYENYTGEGGSIVMHIAGFRDVWINRDLLWIVYHYPLVQLGCKQIFAQVATKNKECISICRGAGWEEVIKLEGVFPDDDMILFRMRRENCRFLKIKPRALKSNKGDTYGQAESSRAA